MLAAMLRSAGAFRLLERALALLLQNRFFEQLQVHVVADGHHVARLLRAEQVARTTDLEVAHRDLEAGAELRVFADGLEALFRDLGEDFALAERQIGVGVPARTADAAAQLMQLREAELVGVLDNEGVDVRDVDAGLDDGRADEDLDVAVREGLHHVAEPFLAHFAVRHGDGDVLAELLLRACAAHSSIVSTRLCR